MIPREIALASKFEIKRKSYATTQYLRTVKILPPLQEVSYKKFVSKKKKKLYPDQQSPTVYAGNSAQCYVAAWMGGEFGGEWIHVYVWLSPFAVHLKLSQRC